MRRRRRDSGKKEAGQRIWIQTDGASPHTSAYTSKRIKYFESKAFYARTGFNLKFVLQPAQSLDMNACDLAFWHSNKCALNGKRWNSKREMVDDAAKAWTDSLYPCSIC